MIELPKIAWPKFWIPQLPTARARASAALVLRPDEVELVWMPVATRQPAHARAAVADATPEALTQAIRQVVDAAQLKSPKVSVSIASPEVLVRFFLLPFIPKAERETATQFEARKYVPFKIDSLAWDYAVVSPEPAGSGEVSQEPLEVIFSAMPLDALGRFRQALTDAGIEALSVEPLSQSLARLTSGLKDRAPQAFDCVVEVRRDQAHLVIARHGMPHLTREVQGAASAEALEQRLLSELSVSMDFFKREYPSAVFSAIWLIGDEAVVARYQQQLGGALTTPVASGRALLSEAERAVPLSVAAGLAVLRRDLAIRPERFLNLFSHGLAAAASAPSRASIAMPTPQDLSALARHPMTIRVGLATAAGLSLALWGLGAMEVDKARRDLDAAKQAREQDRFGLHVMTREMLQTAQDKSQEQLRLLKQLMDQQPHVAQQLDALARSLPEGVWLTGITFEDRLAASSSAGKNTIGRQAKLLVNGACFLGASDRELKAIQEFEARVKHNARLQPRGSQVRLGKIDAAATGVQQDASQPSYAYKTFQLSCQSSGRL